MINPSISLTEEHQNLILMILSNLFTSPGLLLSSIEKLVRKHLYLICWIFSAKLYAMTSNVGKSLHLNKRGVDESLFLY